jgi:hypothetical protein
VRYFVYISKNKVDMLFGQIHASFLDGLSGKVEVNLLMLKSKLKKDANEPSLYQKLAAIEKYIEKHQGVGTIDSPQPYVKGTMDMSWGLYASSLVFFVGTTSESILSLGGSTHNVIGHELAHPTVSYSDTPHMLALLEQEFALTTEAEARDETESDGFGDRTNQVLRSIEQASITDWGVRHRVSFLAKRLLQGAEVPKSRNLITGLTGQEGGRKRVVLGTPLYVALAL